MKSSNASIETRLHLLETKWNNLEDLKLTIDISKLKARVLDLEYRVKQYPTKDDALKGIRELELKIADPAPRSYVLGELTNPLQVARDDLENLLKYAFGRGWLSTVDWDAVGGK